MLLESKDEDGDAETRIESLFQRLNADALRFQDLYYNERQYLQQLISSDAGKAPINA